MSHFTQDIRDLIPQADLQFVKKHRVQLEPGCTMNLSDIKYGGGGENKGIQGLLIALGAVLVAVAGYTFYKAQSKHNPD